MCSRRVICTAVLIPVTDNTEGRVILVIPLPRMVPCSVSASASLVDASPYGPVGFSFANPKSRSFAPAFVSMMLPGFRSRCVTPWRWALSRASAISMA